jgi:hypothetical protein
MKRSFHRAITKITFGNQRATPSRDIIIGWDLAMHKTPAKKRLRRRTLKIPNKLCPKSFLILHNLKAISFLEAQIPIIRMLPQELVWRML